MDIMNMILQQMGMGGAPTGPVAGPGDPEPLLPGQQPRQADPAFAAAMQEWMNVNEREPATDSDFAEIESMVTTGDVSRQATQNDVLRTVTGTRGSQGANARGDDENLPASDRMHNVPEEELEYDRLRDGEAGATAPVSSEELAAMDPQDALMMSMGDEWSPEDYAIMQKLTPEERIAVYDDIKENDFMTDPLAPYRR